MWTRIRLSGVKVISAAVLGYLLHRFPGRFIEDVFMGWLQGFLAEREQVLMPLAKQILSVIITWVGPFVGALGVILLVYHLGTRQRPKRQGSVEHRLHIDTATGKHIVSVRAVGDTMIVDTVDEPSSASAITREGGNTAPASTTSTTPADLVTFIRPEGEPLIIRASVEVPPSYKKRLAAIYRSLVRNAVKRRR